MREAVFGFHNLKYPPPTILFQVVSKQKVKEPSFCQLTGTVYQNMLLCAIWSQGKLVTLLHLIKKMTYPYHLYDHIQYRI